MRDIVKALCDDRRGAAAAEYGILVAVLVTLMVAGLTQAGTAIDDAFQSISTLLSGLA